MTRDNFSPDTKRRLALRAGYQCSICGQLTVGPSEESERAVNLTGEAAHICSAASGGRRYNRNQTPEQGAGIDNGIWLCSYHADLVDGDESTFTVEELRSWKERHEDKVFYKQQGIRVERGLIVEIDLSNFGEITNNVNLKFSDHNLIVGGNGVGKTLICQMIGALTDKKHLKRWYKRRSDDSNSYCCIQFFRNERSKFTIAISSRNEISYSFNDAVIPLLIAPFYVFHLEMDMYRFRDKINRERDEKNEMPLDENDLLTWLALYFGLSTQEFCNVVESMKKEKKFFINDIRVNEEEKIIEVKYRTRSNDGFHPFWNYSDGEQQRIVLEIALKIATYYARFQTTILLLENSSIGIIDQTGLNKLLDIIRQEELGFQFFFTSFHAPGYFEAAGYTIYQLKKTGRNQGVVADLVSS